MPAPRTRLLLLGGTAEARELARVLHNAGVEVVSSLAGRVSRPRLPVGEVRVGGFGGAAGLAHALVEGRFSHLVDATHPFAATMTEHAVEAGELAGVPVLRLARPGWAAHPHSVGWHWVDTLDAARDVGERLGARPFLTTGRQTLASFSSWSDRPVLVRVVEPLDPPGPPAWTVVLDRGPYAVEPEEALMSRHGVDVLLTKDSGGGYTAAKLDAAHRLGIPVVVVRRPPTPAGIARTASIARVVDWLSGSCAVRDPRRRPGEPDAPRSSSTVPGPGTGRAAP